MALYAGLFEPQVQRFVLRDLPASHRRGPILLNVLRVLDAPQAVALAFPRRVGPFGSEDMNSTMARFPAPSSTRP